MALWCAVGNPLLVYHKVFTAFPRHHCQQDHHPARKPPINPKSYHHHANHGPPTEKREQSCPLILKPAAVQDLTNSLIRSRSASCNQLANSLSVTNSEPNASSSNTADDASNSRQSGFSLDARNQTKKRDWTRGQSNKYKDPKQKSLSRSRSKSPTSTTDFSR